MALFCIEVLSCRANVRVFTQYLGVIQDDSIFDRIVLLMCMKKILKTAALVLAFAATGCGSYIPDELMPEDPSPSLSVNVDHLEFAARDPRINEIIVYAKNLKWSYLCSSTWLNVIPKGSDTLRITVSDNMTTLDREGMIIVMPANDMLPIPAVKVTVTQKGVDGKNYSVEFETEFIEFEAENAEPQYVPIHVSGPILWDVFCMYGEGAIGWVSFLPQKDGIFINVKDNPNPEQRFATLVLYPNIEGVETNRLYVKQAGKSADDPDDPDDPADDPDDTI